MKILIINDYANKFGGTEEFVYSLKNNLERRSHQVEILGSNSGQDFKSGFSRFYSSKWYKVTSDKIKSFSPDIVHIQNCSRILSVSVINASLDNNVPVIMTAHDVNLIYNYKPNFNLVNILKYFKVIIHRKVINNSKILLIFPSEFLRNKFKLKFKNNLKIIHNGVDIPNKPTNYEKDILFVGRICKEKGLNVISKILNETSTYNVKFLGEGPLKEKLSSEYKNIQFLGFQKPDDYYKHASILILPSIVEENQPLSILEAMSHGLCVIASNIGGIPEQIKHMETGLLFEPGNEKDFKEKLDYLLKNPKEIKRMGKNAREFVKKNFNWDKTVKEYEKVYEEEIERFKR